MPARLIDWRRSIFPRPNRFRGRSLVFRYEDADGYKLHFRLPTREYLRLSGNGRYRGDFIRTRYAEIDYSGYRDICANLKEVETCLKIPLVRKIEGKEDV